MEELFAQCRLQPPWTLCPSTTDPAVAAEMLRWSAAGLEGLMFKRLEQPYRGGVRAWQKYRVRHSTEAVVGAVTGALASPTTALLGRFDSAGRLHYAGRTTVLNPAARTALAADPRPGQSGHPWTGWSFSAGWGSRERLEVRLIEPDVVVEVAADVSRDASGRWRHPIRLLRVRTDLAPTEIPRFDESP